MERYRNDISVAVYADKGKDTEKQYYVTDPHGNVVHLIICIEHGIKYEGKRIKKGGFLRNL